MALTPIITESPSTDVNTEYRNVILIINTGGTFSAMPREHLTTQNIALDKAQATNITQFILGNWRRHIRGFHGGLLSQLRLPFSLEWAVPHPAQYILSENATISTWRSLAERIREAVAAQPGRILGVVVLHGTDTLAMAAPAVRFHIEAQSMPIVFVGSNRPLLSDTHQGYRLATFSSDAWYQLLQAITFIATSHTFLHDTCVLFNDAVLSAINIRKVPALERGALTAPRGHWGHLQIVPELFGFQNLLSPAPSMGRFIAGSLCLASDPCNHVGEWTKNVVILRPWLDESFPIDSLVGRAHAAPSPVSRMPQANSCRAVLVETYASGTIPTRMDHPLMHLFKAMQSHGAPVFLSGPFGIDLAQSYAVESLVDAGLSVYRFGALIPETAYPLLAVAVGSVLCSKPGLEGFALGNEVAEECKRLLNAPSYGPQSQLAIDRIGA